MDGRSTYDRLSYEPCSGVGVAATSSFGSTITPRVTDDRRNRIPGGEDMLRTAQAPPSPAKLAMSMTKRYLTSPFSMRS